MRRLRYRGALAVLLALGFPSVGRADDAAVLYDASTVSQIDLTLSPEAIQALGDEPKEYVDGRLRLTVGERVAGPKDVEVKLKGNSSFEPIGRKAAFKVKFGKADRLLGLRKLTLNNMANDPSMVHETLAYEVLRGAGVPAPRTGFAYVRVNGHHYGLYLNLETYDDVSLSRLFATTQHLYEADPVADVTPGGADDYEVDEGDEDDRSDLEALIAAANATEGDWSDGMAGVADLDEMTRMWAGEQYVGHWDGYSVRSGERRPNNYYLHSDETGRFTMLPSGTDHTFERHDPLPAEGSGVLASRCRGDDSCLQAFRSNLGQVAAAAERLGAGTRLDEIASVVGSWRSCPDRRQRSDASWQAAILATREFIRTRRMEVAEYLGAPAPAPDPALEATDPPALTAGCPLTPRTPTPTEPGQALPTLAVSSASSPRVAPRSFTVRVAPRADVTAPFRFTIRGALLPPAPLDPKTACRGDVLVRIKTGKRIIWVRRARLGQDCRFASAITFMKRRRFAGRRTLTVRALFRGNEQLLPVSAARRTLRVRR